MKHRFLYSVLCVIVLVAVAQGQSSSQVPAATSKRTKPNSTPVRTADGRPDFQGFWVNNSATPLERPKELAGRATLTDEEVAAMKKKAHELFSGNGDAAFGDTVFNVVWANLHGTRSGFLSTDGETGDYSSVWNDERYWEIRTSLISDPPDGRLPAMTPEGQKRRDAAREAMRRRPQGPEDRSLSERCITYGSPQLTAGYQSYYQVVQTPKSVMFMTEMIHDVRHISLEGSHPDAAVQEWVGDSRGHWEGDTLVIDTTNYKPRAFMSASSEKLHVTERFYLSGPDTLNDEIRVEDPVTWTQPFSLKLVLRRSTEPVYEYACHEGNEGLRGILAGARAEEAEEAKKASQR
jgi:hypothetical protein